MRGVFFTALALIVLTVFGDMWYAPPPAMFYYREVINDPVAPGGNLKIHIRSTISRPCDRETVRTLVDSSGHVFPPYVTTPRPVVRDLTIELPIPLDAKEGPAQIMATVRWKCNIVQNYFPVTVDLLPLDFIIGKPKP